MYFIITYSQGGILRTIKDPISTSNGLLTFKTRRLANAYIKRYVTVLTKVFRWEV